MDKKSLSKQLTTAQIKELKDIILGDIERIQNSFLERGEELQEDLYASKDEVDSANNSILMASNLRYKSRDNLYLKKLKKSLIRIQDGVYGICEDCGVDINFLRLKARVTSELCLSCKEESEREEYQSISGRVSKSLGSSSVNA